MTTWREVVLEGVKESARLHEELAVRSQIEAVPGSIDVFGAIVRMKIPLMFRPLDGLLGTYLPKPAPGIMVTTERNLAIQRITAAHELGHCYMGHEVSLDRESILERSPFGFQPYDPREAAADAFGVSFLLPKWLLEFHAARQHWNARSMQQAVLAYQMSLRVGASYRATCHSLKRFEIIEKSTLNELLKTQPKRIKRQILGEYEMPDWHADVWVLTEADQGTRIQGGPNDVFVLKLRENSGAGYLWKLDDLKAAGFAVVTDTRGISGDQQEIGGLVERVLTARLDEPNHGQSGLLSLDQVRPWAETAEPAGRFSFNYELFGKESGLPRAARQLAAA
jgi:predicted secreted protein/Zn-dependent peptidase ImmA (M78 family)